MIRYGDPWREQPKGKKKLREGRNFIQSGERTYTWYTRYTREIGSDEKWTLNLRLFKILSPDWMTCSSSSFIWSNSVDTIQCIFFHGKGIKNKIKTEPTKRCRLKPKLIVPTLFNHVFFAIEKSTTKTNNLQQQQNKKRE